MKVALESPPVLTDNSDLEEEIVVIWNRKSSVNNRVLYNYCCYELKKLVGTQCVIMA